MSGYESYVTLRGPEAGRAAVAPGQLGSDRMAIAPS